MTAHRHAEICRLPGGPLRWRWHRRCLALPAERGGPSHVRTNETLLPVKISGGVSLRLSQASLDGMVVRDISASLRKLSIIRTRRPPPPNTAIIPGNPTAATVVGMPMSQISSDGIPVVVLYRRQCLPFGPVLRRQGQISSHYLFHRALADQSTKL
jgi:hypothetical protein